MFIKQSRRFLVGIFLLQMLAACTGSRPSDSTVYLDFSSSTFNKNSALNLGIEDIVIQISGAGLTAPIYHEIHCSSAGACGSFQQQVPPGNKLIQVFTVGEQDGVSQIYYSGQFHNLKSGDQAISVVLKSLGQVSSDITGQYIPSSGPLVGQQLTGNVKVSMKYGTHLPLQVYQFEIFGGFFRSFLMDDIDASKWKLEYDFKGWNQGGSALAGKLFADMSPQGLSHTSSGLFSASNNLVTVKTPQHFDSDGTIRSARSVTYGYLGASASSKTLCWKDSSLNINFNGQGTNTSLCADSGCSSYVQWPAGLASVDGTSNITFDQFTTAPAACAGSPAYSEALFLHRKLVDDGGHGLGLFMGPLRAVVDGSNTFHFPEDVVSSGSPQIKFATFDGLPPGVTYHAYAFTGYREREEFQVDDSEGFDCAAIAGEFTALPTTANSTSKNIVVNMTGATSSSTIAICAKDPSGIFFKSALFSNDHDGGGGSGGSPPPMIAFSLLNPADGSYLQQNMMGLEFDPVINTSGPLDAYVELKNISGSSLSFAGTNLSLNVGGQDTNPFGIAFKPDGLKMYIMGYTGKSVYQYSLTTPWDITAATYDSVAFSVAGEEALPNSLAFKADGSKMYILGTGTDTVYQYGLATPWDMTTASYDSMSFDISGQATNPNALSFNADGSKLLVLGSGSGNVYEYTLTNWDLTTASYSGNSFSVTSQEATPLSMSFKSDGKKMFVVGSSSDSVHQYTLSTPWDLTTVTYDGQAFSVGDQDANPYGLTFRPDGSQMYMLGIGTDKVFHYAMKEPWNISQASHDTAFNYHSVLFQELNAYSYEAGYTATGIGGGGGPAICKENTTLANAASCHLKLVFHPEGSNGVIAGSTFHTVFDSAMVVGGVNHWASLPVTAPVFAEYSDPTGPLDVHLVAEVAQGKSDIKYVRITRSVGGSTMNFLPSAFDAGKLKVSVHNGNCTTTPDPGTCDLKFEFNGDHDGSSGYSVADSSSSITWNLNTIGDSQSVSLNSSGDDQYTFPSSIPLSGSAMTTMNFVNESPFSAQLFAVSTPQSQPWTTSHSGGTGCGGGPPDFLITGYGDFCAWDVTAANTPGGLNSTQHSNIHFYYEIKNTYRGRHWFLNADFD